MRTSMIIGALLAGGIALTGCTPSEEPSTVPPAPGTPPPPSPHGSGGGEGGGPHAVSEHTGTDQQFAQQLLRNREQVTELSRLATQNAEKPEIKQFATTLQQEQPPKVAEITAWLGSTANKQSGSAPEDASSETAEQAGTLSPQELQKLSQLHGTEFDRQWAPAMLALHEGAVQLAKTELDEGSAQPMREAAEKVTAADQDKIDQLRALQPHP